MLIAPAPKKRKTGADTAAVPNDDEAEDEEEDEAEAEVEGDENGVVEDGEDDAAEEEAEVGGDEEGTAEKSGPAAAAKANKGGEVPEEKSLDEVDAAE